MPLFEFTLILLTALLASNVINRFLPTISVPIIQIILGVVIALLPFGVHPELKPDLFFVLFIAPLVFYISMTSDKKVLWELKSPIINMAVLLVFVTVISMGYFVHLLIPIIPLAAAFILVAAMAPTDIVAVSSVEGRIRIPHKLMGILSGESAINDASGIVCFQFAVAAMLTGSFSFIDVSVKFLILGIGGLLLGLLFTLLKYLFVRWLRLLGMENVTLHILIGILTPFIIYLIAEACNVSGILAVFASGIAHSFGKKQLNPETANLNAASKSIWEVIAFTLEGLVFVILGTQLPDIIKTVGYGSFPIKIWEIIAYVFVITLAFALSRFIWSYLTIKKNFYTDSQSNISKFKASLIFGLSGARGAVTMASALSIPFVLNDGTAFPQRDLIVLISTGVILCSLLITNFILPLLVEEEIDKKADENAAQLEILQNVIRQLGEQTAMENKYATEQVIGNYYRRSIELRQKGYSHNNQDEQKLAAMTFEWEKENTNTLFERGEIGGEISQHYLQILDSRNKTDGRKRISVKMFLQLARNIFSFVYFKNHGTPDGDKRFKQYEKLRESNCEFVISKLRELNLSDPSVSMRIAHYESELSMQKMRGGASGRMEGGEGENVSIEDVVAVGFQLERDNIQLMFENGRISRETANAMRKNIALSELQMKEEEKYVPGTADKRLF